MKKKIEKVFNFFQKIKNKIFKKVRILAWKFFCVRIRKL